MANYKKKNRKNRDPKIDTRVKWMMKKKVNQISSIISPSEKSLGVIEGVVTALEYYKDYTKQVVLQPKWMGSYCCMYLFKDHSKSYFTSRNGYLINFIEGLHEASQLIHDSYFQNNPTLEWIMLEAELLPWSAMGKGLIEREFVAYADVHEKRIDLLQSSNIFDKIKTVKLGKPWLKPELKAHEKRQYKALEEIEIENLEQSKLSVTEYKEVLNQFGAEGPLEFKVFTELKCKYEKQPEFIFSTNVLNKPNKEHVVIDVTDTVEALRFFTKNAQLDREGIVVKPLEQNLINVAPCLKVRTNRYLQLIYGIDFKSNFNKYYDSRNIKRKLSQSISDYELAIQLKYIPREELTMSNKNYQRLLYLALDGEENLKMLDKSL